MVHGKGYIDETIYIYIYVHGLRMIFNLNLSDYCKVMGS